MKYSIILFCSLAFSLAHGQITIVDKTLNPIESVQLFSTSDFKGISDKNGVINIDTSSISKGIWKLRHAEYYTKSINSEILQNSTTIILSKRTNNMDAVVILPPRNLRLNPSSASQMDVITKKNIDLYQPQTAADLLNLENKVYIQKSQQGGGSPMIRGFATNRILLVIDNVRMNTAIFREGNVQNVISLDPLSMASTEVIFGPASQFYGSDAIGGVLNFKTKTASFAQKDTTLYDATIVARYSSANAKRTLHTDLSISKQHFSSYSNVTLAAFKDLTMGKNGPQVYTRPDYIVFNKTHDSTIVNENVNKQRFSSYNQINLIQKFNYKLTKNLMASYGFHASATSNIPRYDRLLIRDNNDSLKFGDWYYGPQKWGMHNFGLDYTNPFIIADSIKLTLAHQKFEESRNSRKRDSKQLTERKEKVNAWSLNMDLVKSLNKKLLLSYGAEYILNTISSVGNIVDITNGTYLPTSSRYPDGSKWSSAGVYSNLQMEWNSRNITESGFRINRVSTYGVFDTTYFRFPFNGFKNENMAITGSVSHTLKLSDGYISLLASTAFRAPNIDDISKIFDRSPGQVVVPNPNLKPEYAYNGEVTIDYILFKNLKFNSSVFYTFLNNAISITDGTFNGQDSILYGNTLSKVKTFANQDYATILGSQIALKYQINEKWDLRTSYTLLSSTSSNNEPIKHITPNFGGTNLTYKSDKWTIVGYATYNQKFANSQFTAAEKSDAYLYALDQNGLPYSPSWICLNARVQSQITSTITIGFGVENIADKRYRPYGSGITASGRNLSLSLKVKLD